MTTDRAADWEEAMDLDLLWVALGRLVIQGKVSLRVARVACAILIVVASYRRNGENKTEAAAELRSSRRVIRELLGRWNDGSDLGALLERLRLEQDPEPHR